MRFNNSPFKKCPRCKTKCFINEKKCHECGLIFERLNYTSNKTAKKNILHGRKDETIMVTEWPFDAKKSTSLWLCGFLGFTGAHNFYLGRFWKASIMLLGLVLAITTVLLSDFGLYGTTLYNTIRYIAIIPGASVLIFWILDFINIFFEKYKIPVSIDENLYNLKPEVIKNIKKDEKLIKNYKKYNKKDKKSKNNNKLPEKTKENILEKN
jgi:TM2 domain-containing membrane protein YozV